MIRGMKLTRLISSPTHAMGQDGADTLIKMPMVMNERNKRLTGGNHVILICKCGVHIMIQCHIFTLKG